MKTKYKFDPVECSFELVCPRKWEDLEQTSESVRYCDQCYSDVYLCKTQEEVEKAKKLNRCIAFARESRVLFMGSATLMPDKGSNIDELLKEADELFAARKSKDAG